MGGSKRAGGRGASERDEGSEALSIRAPHVGFMVERTRLLRDLDAGGREAGLIVVCAPSGFGKTALLLQYASMVKCDVSRGHAQVIDASSVDPGQLVERIRDAVECMEPATHPLIAVDNMPSLSSEALACFAEHVRAWRARGYEFLIAGAPPCGALLRVFGDSYKVGAQALRVRADEYPQWVKTFSISSSLDVYGLTQGVPCLVALLQTVTDRKGGRAALHHGVECLYRSVLEGLSRSRDSLHRLACLFVLMGEGSVADLNRCGLRVKRESLSRMAHDYPLFGLDTETGRFCCIEGGSQLDRLRVEIASSHPDLALKACRILVASGHADRAVRLAEMALDNRERCELIDRYPARFALSGNPAFVRSVAGRMAGESAACVHSGMLLSVYLCALVSGAYRVARTACAEIRRRAHELEHEIDAGEWALAVALGGLWRGCADIELPRLSDAYTKGCDMSAVEPIRRHGALYRALVGGKGKTEAEGRPEIPARMGDDAVDIPRILLVCDRLLGDALQGGAEGDEAYAGELEGAVDLLTKRGLGPIAARVRMVDAVCRLMQGRPIADERAFSDAETVAVRESDLDTQTFCMTGEGWQALLMGQSVNARFRAQQVLKLAGAHQVLVRQWARLLERCSFILDASNITIRNEAELIDLAQRECAPDEVWATALHLSAAHLDSELSAWFSLHKRVLLDERIRPFARQAMAAIGTRADGIRRLLPSGHRDAYLIGDGGAREKRPVRPEFDPMEGGLANEMGQVSIGLFGGFRAKRNGHTLTDGSWKRKKASVLAARLVLVLGSFVSRKVITEEIWPDADYAHARECLYVTLSSLRHAFGQQADGPQYVLTQGDGLALNSEYVASDTARFDILARDVLLGHADASGRHVVESCLKLEQLYTGPLYTPDVGDATFYTRMRRVYLTKFIDCMLRGIDAAIEIDDLASASWLTEAALRHAPLREDVIRRAMRVYDASGRRREVVELYNSHLYCLEHEFNELPDEKTRMAYEEIVGKMRVPAMM